MCFSATSSYTAAALLTGLGAAAAAKGLGQGARMLGTIPFIFAAQQLTEGTVWWTFDEPRFAAVHAACVVVFLSFALVMWPTWFPLALYHVEPDARRKRRLRALVAMGMMVSALGVVALIGWSTRAGVQVHSIHYAYGPPIARWGDTLYLFLYVVPTVGSFFLSSLRWMKATGVVLLVALITTMAMERGVLTSVWCFFAAAISLLVVMALPRPRAWSSPGGGAALRRGRHVTR
jgi:hypothetical protein